MNEFSIIGKGNYPQLFFDYSLIHLLSIEHTLCVITVLCTGGLTLNNTYSVSADMKRII